MKLGELFTGKANTENTSYVVPSQYAKTADLNRQIRQMVPGQLLQGEVVSRNGSEVQLRLADDMLLNARVDQSINLETGKLLTFEVKNNGTALTLSPLFTNVSADVNVLKALDMALLPVNTTTVDMTEQLMQAGIPVNRANLQQVYREINLFPESEVADIVNLHRLEMPVTEANVEQMMSYRNLSYQLSDAVDTVLQLIPGAAEEMLAQGEEDSAVRLCQQLLSMVQEGAAPTEEAAQAAGDKPAGVISAEGILTEGISAEELAAEDLTGKEAAAAGIEESVEAQGTSSGTAPDGVQDFAKTPLTGAERQELARQVLQFAESLELSPEQGQLFSEKLNGFADGTVSSAEFFGLSAQLMQAAGGRGMQGAAVKELFGDNAFQKLVTAQLEEQWTIRPEDVESREKVNDLYSRLGRQLDGIGRALEESGQSSGSLYKAVSQTSQSIDFLQQLNQMYTYIQLPLKLQQGQANGDLYVYTNKRNLASQEGKISAFLHLDMEHLGPVDVYVTLQDNKVSTKFSVQDEEMLDFLEEHMGILTERLQKRGYDCDYSMSVRDDAKEEGEKGGGLAPVLQQVSDIPLTRYSFDVRT